MKRVASDRGVRGVKYLIKQLFWLSDPTGVVSLFEAQEAWQHGEMVWPFYPWWQDAWERGIATNTREDPPHLHVCLWTFQNFQQAAAAKLFLWETEMLICAEWIAITGLPIKWGNLTVILMGISYVSSRVVKCFAALCFTNWREEEGGETGNRFQGCRKFRRSIVRSMRGEPCTQSVPQNDLTIYSSYPHCFLGIVVPYIWGRISQIYPAK